MEWLAAAIALVGAGAAFWQASEARAARRDAAASASLAEQAVSAAKSSASSAERSADALEEQTRLLREQRPKVPRWRARPNGQWSSRVVNLMNRRVFDVEVKPVFVSESATFVVRTKDLTQIDSRGWIDVDATFAAAEADFVRFEISWREADQPARERELIEIRRPSRRASAIVL